MNSSGLPVNKSYSFPRISFSEICETVRKNNSSPGFRAAAHIAFVLDVMPSFFTETAVHVAKAKGRFCAQWETQMDDSGPSVSRAADDGGVPALSSWTTEPIDNTYTDTVLHMTNGPA